MITPARNAFMMRIFGAVAGLVLFSGAVANDLVSDNRIKVFLFASPGFWSTSAIDAYKDACAHLDNNL